MAKVEKLVLGMIPCPHCPEQMAVKHDKNGDPFGHCEECGGQLRVGGKPSRVRAFVAKYPWAAKPAEGGEAPVTVTVSEKSSAPPPVAVSEPAPPVVKRRAGFADALGLLGARHAA